MRRLPLFLAALGAALLFPTLATAKGPDRASISGPGLAHPMVIGGNGESDSSALGTLATAGGFFAQMYGATASGTLGVRPKTSLGPRYVVTYRVPGGSAEPSTVRQDLYPYAAGGPVSYMTRGQTFWDTQKTVGGWFRGTPSVKQMLVQAGLPAKAPPERAAHAHKLSVALGAGAGIAVAAGGLALLYRRRRRCASR
jgi:hypothetical protein